MTEPTFRTASVFDGTGTGGKPVVDRHMLDTTEAELVLTYLESAPTIMPAYRFGLDRVDGTRGQQVPLTWHTDGTWVWPGAVTYYLRTYAMPPHVDLLTHIRQRQYEAPAVEPAVKLAALAAVSGSARDRAAEEEDHAVSTSMSAEASVMAGSAASDDSAAFDRLRSAAVDLGAPVGAYRIGASADGAWCLFRDGSRWTVFLADRGTRKSAAAFDTSQQAIAYLVGQLYLANKGGAPAGEIPTGVAGGKVATTVDAPAADVFATVTEPPVEDAFDPAEFAGGDAPAADQEPAVASAPPRTAPPPVIPFVAASSTVAPIVTPSAPLAGLAAAGLTARKMQSPVAGDDDLTAAPTAFDDAEQPPAADPDEPTTGQPDEFEPPAATARRPGVEALFGRRHPGTDSLTAGHTSTSDALPANRALAGTDVPASDHALASADSPLADHTATDNDPLAADRTATGSDSPPAGQATTGPDSLLAGRTTPDGDFLSTSHTPTGTDALLGNRTPTGTDSPLASRTPTGTEPPAVDAQPAAADEDAARQQAPAAAALSGRQSASAKPAAAPPSTTLASSTLTGYPAGSRSDIAASPPSQPGPWRIRPLPGEPPLTLYRDKRLVMLPTGTEVDRYGEPDGNVTYAARTQYQHRSLPSEWSHHPYHVYRLQRPVEALTGLAVPWFEQPGGGTAFVLPGSINDLLADGSLVEITVQVAQPQPVQS